MVDFSLALPFATKKYLYDKKGLQKFSLRHEKICSAFLRIINSSFENALHSTQIYSNITLPLMLMNINYYGYFRKTLKKYCFFLQNAKEMFP